MIEWIKENMAFIMAIMGGSLVSTVSIKTKSIIEAVMRMGCGIVSAVLFTDGFISWQGLDYDTFVVAVAGMFAITGFGLVKILSNISMDNIIHVVKMIRGS
jgi:hypothetical protein